MAGATGIFVVFRFFFNSLMLSRNMLQSYIYFGDLEPNERLGTDRAGSSRFYFPSFWMCVIYGRKVRIGVNFFFSFFVRIFFHTWNKVPDVGGGGGIKRATDRTDRRDPEPLYIYPIFYIKYI